MAAIIIEDRMPQLLDARGLACPLPAIKARAALAVLAPGETLIVLATDPEAPVDIGALAADAGHGFRAEREGAAWRLVVTKESS
jgi:tRNA 2-thiouridine synthesizing protein A